MQYSLKYLKKLPTLCVAQTDNLKIQTASKRVWLARTGVLDGEAYNNRVSVEELTKNGWRVVENYQAR
ncbi:hypothetical protein QT972_10980 [Microcoleus sp. herbarium7]